jgi:acetyl esterase/lipase
MKPHSRAGLAGLLALAGACAAGGVALGDETAITPDVVYGHKDGMALTYDVFTPENANGAGVLYMVSGGWFSFWRDPETRVAGFGPLLDEGFTVFAVHHGSAPRFKVPEAVADVRRATRHIHMNADEYGVDADRLGVYGMSAGGHLSLVLGLAGDDGDPEAEDEVERHSSRIAAVVSYFPPSDIRPLTGPNERFPALDFDEALAADISPILFADELDPPTLIQHGDADELVPVQSGISMHEALDAAGAETNLIIYEGAEHGFQGEDATNAMNATVAWFVDHLE